VATLTKGDQTREAVLAEALAQSSQVGLRGITIGGLAESMGMSKSGLFAHFGSKESLQLQVHTFNVERFTAEVIRPALREPRGEPRVRALFERWLSWASASGGCPILAASFEFDDQPGPVRDRLVRDQRDWLDTIAMVFAGGVTEGHFHRDADPCQFAQDLEGVMLAHHLTSRLLQDPDAERRTRRSLDVLLAAAGRPPQD
jgi:AcrR family transcriptional regulator